MHILVCAVVLSFAIRQIMLYAFHPKSVGFPQFQHIINNNIIPGQVVSCEEFVEGTNINVFYHNDI